jgi:hypothetical protein
MKNHILKLFILLIGFAALVSGCATRMHNGFGRGGAEESLPKLTSVITGPVGVLLTNGNVFSSDFTMAFEEDSEHTLKISGQVLVRGGKLRLEAVFDKSNSKSMVAGDIGVIWDAASNQGYVFSEDLQGYAPISETVHFTNILTQVVTSPIERIEGHPVEKANLTFTCSDGQTMDFQLYRVQGVGNLPMQIKSLNSAQFFTLALSKIRLETPAEELFLPPDGFTKYESEAAMLSELGIRQQAVFSEKHDQGGININYKPAVGGQN